MENKKKTFVIISFAVSVVLVALSFIDAIPFPLRLIFSVAVYIYFGKDVLLEMIECFSKKDFFNEYSMMIVATVGAFAIGEFADAAAVMLFYSIGEFLTDLACDRSRDKIEELIDRTPEYASLLRSDGSVKKVSPFEVKVGDHISVIAGEKIPLDGTVVSGSANVDVSAITGESVPVSLFAGEKCTSGSVCLDGKIEIEVSAVASESVASRISSAAKEALESKSDGEKFTDRFAKIYTPAAFVVAILVFVIGMITTGELKGSLRLSIIILAISCPCALVLSVPLTFVSGLGTASSLGIMFRGANALERTAELKSIAFDKTGTITGGNLTVSEISVKEEILPFVLSVLTESNHPLSKAFCAYAKERGISSSGKAEEIKEIAGLGVCGEVSGKKMLIGNARLLSENGISAELIQNTSFLIAVDGEYAGSVSFSDSIKKESKSTIERLEALGVGHIEILSGDAEASVKKVAEEVGIKEFRFGLLPSEKAERMSVIKAEADGKCGYVGDGLNDSAVIATADVGVAMGRSGAALSVEAADLVLMNDELSSLCSAMSIAKKTKRIAVQNVVISLLAKLVILLISIFIVPSMELAVIADVGVALLCVLNAVRKKI